MIRPAILIGFCVAAAQAAHGAALPLEAGVYVRDGVPCHDAPFAALIQYDGASFSGPHSSDCTTTVVNRNGAKSYSLQTTCHAAGDGSAAAGSTEKETLTVLSPSHLIFAHPTGLRVVDQAAYRLCRSAGPT